MNLQKLFSMQAMLDADILKRHPVQLGEDRLSKKILALLVELGECANEFRGFKFWSNDQEPRTHSSCNNCSGLGKGYFSGKAYTGSKELCSVCEGTGINKSDNPLLEEYVDCLHFILSIGNDLKIPQHNESSNFFLTFKSLEHWTVTKQFNYTFRQVMKFGETVDKGKPDAFLFMRIVRAALQLGHKLGFTWEQIEQAYCEKNKINLERQINNY